MVMPGVISAPRPGASARPARSVSASDPMFFTVTVSLLRRLPPPRATDPRSPKSLRRSRQAAFPHGTAETLCPARVAAGSHVASPRRVERSARARLALGAYRIPISGEPKLLQDENAILRAHVPPRAPWIGPNRLRKRKAER